MRLVTSAALLFLVILFAPARAQSDKPRSKTTFDTPEAVLEANLEATGGREAWAAVRTRQEEGERATSGIGPQKNTSRFETTIQYPGHLRMESEAQTQDGPVPITIVTTPDSSWAVSPMGRQTLPGGGPSVPPAKQELDDLTNPAVTLDLALGTFEDVPVYVIMVRQDTTTLRRWYDRETLFLLAAETAAPEGISTSRFDHYREADGLMVPFMIEQDTFGRFVMQSGNDTEPTVTIQPIHVQIEYERIAYGVALDEGFFSDS